MGKALLPDELWALIAAHLPKHSPSPKGGRPRISDRAALTGILFVLRTGIPWEYLPREFGCGSGMTCWRRLYEWMQVGVWQSVHEAVLRRLREYDQIAWDRASIDAASVPSPRGGEHTGRNPTDRGKLGCKPRSCRSAWITIGGPNLRCASARFPAAHIVSRVNPGHQRSAGPSSQTSRKTACRPRLCITSASCLAAPARYRRAHRSLWRRVTRAAWPLALGRRTNPWLASSVPQIADPLRAPCGYSPSLSFACMRDHLLAVRRAVLLNVLSPIPPGNAQGSVSGGAVLSLIPKGNRPWIV